MPTMSSVRPCLVAVISDTNTVLYTNLSPADRYGEIALLQQLRIG
jgi:hypothetical protein